MSVKDRIKLHLLVLQNIFFEWLIFRLFPRDLVYNILHTSVCYIAMTVPAMSLLSEMRRRGLIEYYCLVRAITEATTGWYSNTVVPDVSLGEVLRRFKEESTWRRG